MAFIVRGIKTLAVEIFTQQWKKLNMTGCSTVNLLYSLNAKIDVPIC